MSVTFYTTNHFWHHYRFLRAAPVCGDVADFSVVPPAGRMKSPVCKYVGTCRPPGSRIFPLKGAMRRQRMPGTCFARAAKRAVQPRGLAPNPVPDA